MLQDRNIHRDAQALRKVVSVPLITPAFGVDQDEPQYITAPRYNFRITDLSVHIESIITAPLIVKAQAVEGINALGSPQLGQGSAVATFTIEEFWRRSIGNASGGFVNRTAVAAQPFGALGVATVLDGFWGVWLVQVNQSNDIDVVAQAPIMAFATEETALANCPKVRNVGGPSDTPGRCAILTVQAVGGDFIAGTTNTDAALVAAFNTAPQDGHVVSIGGGGPSTYAALLGQQLKDASGEAILQGRGSGEAEINETTGAPGDLLAISVRSDGIPVIGPTVATVEYRPWPAGGEGLGDASVSQNRPSFVP
ncbi:MAG: hypothetical protein KAJ42_00790 [Gemmatimonadetes bacterium]|nr:hypothetical protein [Gemmatimonadota bacterium]